ncbi:hypothetical protein HY524_00190 [Candidatus Berkelbacteria bacterium]|nr:hypothetical protein [Candidatus Berkelbacteria bacterium]
MSISRLRTSVYSKISHWGWFWIFAIAVGGFLLITRLATRPAKGVIVPASMVALSNSVSTVEKIEGTNLTFNVPSGYIQNTHERDVSDALERYILYDREKSGTKKAAITVTPMTSELLNTVSGVALRRSQPKVYTERPVSASKTSIDRLVFARSDETGTELTLFWSTDGLLVTVALTSETIGLDLQPDFNVISKSLQLLAR